MLTHFFHEYKVDIPPTPVYTKSVAFKLWLWPIVRNVFSHYLAVQYTYLWVYLYKWIKNPRKISLCRTLIFSILFFKCWSWTTKLILRPTKPYLQFEESFSKAVYMCIILFQPQPEFNFIQNRVVLTGSSNILSLTCFYFWLGPNSEASCTD